MAWKRGERKGRKSVGNFPSDRRAASGGGEHLRMKQFFSVIPLIPSQFKRKARDESRSSAGISLSLTKQRLFTGILRRSITAISLRQNGFNSNRTILRNVVREEIRSSALAARMLRNTVSQKI